MLIRYRPADLAPNVRTYLNQIRRSQGGDASGVYFKKSVASTWWLLLLGLGMLGLAVLLLFSSKGHDWKEFWPFQAVLFSAGTLLFVSTAHTLSKRRNTMEYLGDFHFIDAQYWWDVSAHEVKVESLEGLSSVFCTHNLNNGSYRNSALRITTAMGTSQKVLHSRQNSEDVTRFMNTVARLRETMTGSIKDAFDRSPAMLGAFARAVMRDGQNVDLNSVQISTEIPALDPSGSTGSDSGRLILQVGATLAAAILAVLTIPRIHEFVQEKIAYDEALHSPASSTDKINYYRQEFPKGPHLAELMDLFDDRTFATAKLESEQKHSPSLLRLYLGNAMLTRHRDEAKQLIAAHYDQAIAHLRELAAKNSDANQDFLNGLVSLLNGLKTADRPVVTIGYKASQIVTPTDADVLDGENEARDVLYQQMPELKNLADRSPKKSCLIDVGKTFDKENVARREIAITERLQETFKQVLDKDILTFETTPQSSDANLEIAYHTTPAGTLISFVQNDAQGNIIGYLGLLRVYRIEWTVSFRPPGLQTPIVLKTPSFPANEFYILPRPSDPDWAPYAVMQITAFYGFSNNLISGFGLKPPAMPNYFTFNDATAGAATTGSGTAPSMKLPKNLQPPIIPTFQLPPIPTFSMPTTK